MKKINFFTITLLTILLILSCSGQTDNQSNNSDSNNNNDDGSSKDIISSDDDYEPIPDDEFEDTSTDGDAGNRYAVVVGVQDYSSSPNFNDLTFTLGDAVRMAKVYESQGAFDVSLFIDKYDLVEVKPDDPSVMKSEDYVPQYKKVYTTDDDGTLPYRDNILDTVRQSVDAIYSDVYDNKNDANKHFLFFFSGHGLKFEGKNYLILKGFGEASSDELQTNAISREELQEMIHSIRDKYREEIEEKIRKIRKNFSDKRIEQERMKRYPENVSINLIFDACRTNEGFKDIVDTERKVWEFDDQPTKGIAVMYSTESGKVSIETPSLGSGVFTYFFEKALLGLADIESKYSLRLEFRIEEGKKVYVEEINKKVLESFGRGDNDGYVTLNEAYDYVNNAMLEWGLSHNIPPTEIQLPFITVDEKLGEMVLSKANRYIFGYPDNIEVSFNEFADRIEISWQDVPEALSYTIHRYEKGDLSDTPIKIHLVSAYSEDFVETDTYKLDSDDENYYVYNDFVSEDNITLGKDYYYTIVSHFEVEDKEKEGEFITYDSSHSPFKPGTTNMRLAESEGEKYGMKLLEALQNKDKALALEALSYNINPNVAIESGNYKSWTSLHYVLSDDGWFDLDLAKLIIEKGADVNATRIGGWTALQEASEYGNLDAVKLLIKNGADVNIAETYNRTPLYYASRYNHPEIAKLLIENGANTNLYHDLDPMSPLHYALVYGHTDVAKLLIEKGANIDVVDNDGLSPLHYALKYGHTDVAELLIDKGADIDVVDNSGSSPLHYALKYGHTDVAELLIDKGADIDVVDNSGWSLLHYALGYGHPDVAELLIDKGAKKVTIEEFKPHAHSSLENVSYRDMVTIPGGTYLQMDEDGESGFKHSIFGFYLSKYETTYELWYTVREWATSNGYEFDNAGREGYDGEDGAEPTDAKYEPVTYINWRDCIVWCNAYSQMCGLSPVYKNAAGDILKNSNNGSECDSAVFDRSTDGYRLPTEGEWQYAASDIGATPYIISANSKCNF